MLGDNGLPSSTITICFGKGPARPDRFQAIVSLLQTAGYQVSHLLRKGPLNSSPDEVLLLLGNANWYPAIYRQLTARPRSERPFVVIWHYEPLPFPAASGFPLPRLHVRQIARILLLSNRASDAYTNYLRLRLLARKQLPDLLVISTRGGWEFLAERRIAAHWVPLGYTPSFGYDMGLSRDIDVLFIGVFNVPRRKRLIGQLRQQGINLVAVGDWSDPAYWGEDRTRLLNRTKIVLNLQRFPGQMSGQRLILGMANMALVISEPMYKPAPYVPGKHYVSATIEEMPQIIRYYLAHENEREAIAREGHHFVTQEVTLERSVSQILRLITMQKERSLASGSREMEGGR